MKIVAEINRNYEINTSLLQDGLVFLDSEISPFRIYGLMRENGRFCRMPENIAESVSEAVHARFANTTGGRVRFRTDSPYIAIHAEMDDICKVPNFTLCGSAGFDLYTEEADGKERFLGVFQPPVDMTDGYESILDLPPSKLRTVTIGFPLYSNVKKLFIGLKDTSHIEMASDYLIEKPVIYYGSSITQGGCASRPGTSYQAIISNHLCINYINMGFSGAACAEASMCEYLASLEMSAFVCDYDYNALDAEFLRRTHLPLYRTIRKKQPYLPIILVSSPDIFQHPATMVERRDIIMATYSAAQSDGDTHISFIDGTELFGDEDWDLCTVDSVHPNDLGFYRMANRIGKEIRRILF